MDDATQAYLIKLGNPYAKLSILSEEESHRQSLPVSPRRRRNPRVRTQSMASATEDYLFNLEDPYAKLSIEDGKRSNTPHRRDETAADPLWRTRTEIHQFVVATFTLPSLLRRQPASLNEFTNVVLRLSPRAQKALEQRICSHTADVEIAHNRLSPKQLDQLLKRLLEMANDAASLDAEGE